MAFLAQLRQALRGFLKSPGFTATAVLTLALGIGANVAIFSVLDAVLFRPLPYPAPERLVALNESNPARAEHLMPVAVPDLLEWRDKARSFEGMAAYRARDFVLTGRGEPERVRAGLSTAGLLELLGATPALGRTYTREEETPGRHRVAVLTHRYWARRLGGDPAVLGGSLLLNGQAYTVVGILPERFSFSVQGSVPDLYLPQPNQGPEVSFGSHGHAGVARLRPGVSLAAGLQELKAISAGLAQSHPDTNTGFTAEARSLHEALVGQDTRPALYVLMGAVGLLLLIACGNVANLLLARALVRERETAIRVALGAGRGALFQKFLAEGLVLGLAGSLAGLLLAGSSLGVLRTLVPRTEVLSAYEGLGLDLSALAFTLALGLGTALAFSLAPLAQLRDRHLDRALREGGRGGTGRGGGLRKALVVAEVALCAFLLLGTGLMLRSLFRLQGTPLGFEPRGVYTFTTSLAGSKRYTQEAEQLAFHRQLLERLRRQPGVTEVGGAWVLPLQGRSSRTTVVPLEQAALPDTQRPSENVNIVTPTYLKAMGIPLLQGRGLAETDTGQSPRAVVVNASFAAKYWPGTSPLGRRLQVGLEGDQPPADPNWEVVGVVGDTRLHAVGKAPEAEVYLPLAQLPVDNLSYVVRTEGSPEAMAAVARAQLRELDGELAVTRGQTMEGFVRGHLEGPRTVLILLGSFAALALALAAVGLYGIITFQVAQRSRELAIRIALGAELRQIVQLVLGQGARLAALGLAAGIAGALVFGRLLRSLLYGVSPDDPSTYLTVALLLSAVALLASLLPALRAARVDPTEALRAD